MGHTNLELGHLSTIGRTSVRLDRVDFKILSALQSDGRITNLKLAELIGLSPTPCLQRVRRLEAGGFIQAYGALLDVGQLGAHITVLTEVTLRSRLSTDTQPFEHHVQQMPLVMECHAVTGGYDYLMKSVARDVGHYQEMIDELLVAQPCVIRYASIITLKGIKQTQAFPLNLFE